MVVEKIAHLTGHSGAIYCLAHYNGNRFFSGGFDNLVVEWDIDNPSTAKAVAKLSSKAISLFFIESRNWLLAGQSTGGVHVIDLDSNKEIHLLQAHEEMVFALYYDEYTSQLYVGAGDGKISIWNFKTMQCEKLVQLDFGKIRDIKENKGLLYIGTESGSVAVLNKQLEEIGLISEHQIGFSVNTVHFHGKSMLTGSRDGHLNELKWKDSYFDVFQKIPAHNYAIYGIVNSPCGKYIATASRDKSVKIWNSDDLSFVTKVDFKAFKGHIGSVNDIIWFDKYLVSVSDDRSVIVWKIK